MTLRCGRQPVSVRLRPNSRFNAARKGPKPSPRVEIPPDDCEWNTLTREAIRMEQVHVLDLRTRDRRYLRVARRAAVAMAVARCGVGRSVAVAVVAASCKRQLLARLGA